MKLKLQKTIYMLSKYFIYGFVVQLMFLNLVMASEVSAQYKSIDEVQLTVPNRTLSINKFIEFVETNTDFQFAFDKKDIDRNQKLHFERKSDSLEGFLRQMAGQASVSFRQVNNGIDVKKVEKNVIPVMPAENKKISGTILDEAGDPIPGATIQVKGTTIGTAADLDGHFQLDVPEGSVVIVSFVGFVSQQIEVGNQSILSIVLKEDTAQLDEVVVVGYGTQKKANLTGSVASVGDELLNKRKIANPSSMLQGVLPGLQVVQNSGAPSGGNVSLLVRGFGTFSGAGVSPLVVIDGIPGSLSGINPNDIETVTLLKDAASAAIYGSRAANGVILVTTKQGKEGKMSLTYDVNIGRHTPTTLPDLIYNSAEYMELYNEAAMNSSGASPIYTSDEINAYKNSNDESAYPNFNWLDFMVNPAYVQNHHLSLNGGNEKTTYNIGLGYIDQPGTIEPFEYDKYNLRLNIASQATERIKIGVNTSFGYDVTDNVPDDMYSMILSSGPTYAPTLPDGRYARNAYEKEVNGNRFQTNPYAMSREKLARKKGLQLQTNAYMDVKIMDGLNWRVKGGLNINNSKTKTFDGQFEAYNYHSGKLSKIENTNSLDISAFNDLYPVLYSHLTYDKVFGDHSVRVLGGYQMESYKYETLGLGRKSYFTNTAQEIDAGPAATQYTSGNSEEWSMLSWFGRLNYAFNDKYLLEANLRADGSSRFAEGNKWGYFPSFSLGWRLSQEGFLQDVDWMSDLKLRGSHGVLGNQDIGYYPYQSVLSIGPNNEFMYGVYPFNGNVVTAVSPSSLVNKDIRWETTSVTNIGFDMGLFNDKLTMNFDWFNKVTDDILRRAQIPAYLGLNAPIINDGTLKNTGFEVAVNYRNIIGEVFYTVGGNVQTFKNELVKFGEREIGDVTINEEGYPYNDWFMWEWDGIFQTEDEIENSATQSPEPQPGDLKYKDQNGDGVIDQDDRVHISGSFPKFTYNFNFSLEYKNFDFAARFYGSQGGKKFLNFQGASPFYKGTPPTVDWRNRWTPENPSNEMPRIYAGEDHSQIFNSKSTYYLKDVSYLRLQNIQIGYTLPKDLLERVGLSNLRVYYAGDNILTFSKLDGFDPERVSNIGTMANYPQNKIHSLGLTVNF
ncbi:SusC/RagA family TonB-linked outer membrane protein [Echinicola shivajiensis]|uniref:SusC/RagA family TonB-linked outer membrane protein n=1 Tax=Echinicola shivajiensis TaxID=1035916 RepID=UPI001BFCD4AA|nr:TonB-dependent receptor [Echinicola shivajiensis]